MNEGRTSWKRRRRCGNALAFAIVATLLLSHVPPVLATSSRAQQDELRLESPVLPVYPAAAISAGVQGSVEMFIPVATDGRVGDVRIQRAVRLLDQAALDGIRKWRFAPRPAPTSVVVTVRFVLTDAPPAQAATPVSDVGWPPADFAIFYRFECPGRELIVSSLAENQAASRESATVLRLALSDAERVELSLNLVQAGFFAAPDATTEREQRSSIDVQADRVDVVVAAQRPLPPIVASIPHAIDSERRVEPSSQTAVALELRHQLMVRTFSVWRILRWNQPVADDDQQGREAARIGEAVREFIRPRIEDRSAREALQCRN